MPPARRSARTAPSIAVRETAGPYATRANRQPSPNSIRPTASITRGANGSSLKLKVKAPSSKLKQVTGAGDGPIPPNPYADLSESDATPQPAGRAARHTRNPRTVVEPDTDEDMEDAEGEELDEDDEMEEDEGEEELESEEDAEGEEDEDEDEDEDDEEDDDDLASDPPPPPPIIRQERAPGKAKPSVTVTAPPEGPVKSVEAKEMEDEDDEDEDLSELQSNLDGEDGEEGEEEDAEGEEDSDEDLDNSRSATPDLTKLTKRQRGAFAEVDTGGLMELSNEAQKKKMLTAEEQVMRRAEMARRRKNLSEKRNEEEKMDTINKLLKKPAPKRRTRAEIIAQQQADMMATPGAEEGEEERPEPLYARWVNNANGSRVGVPEEWMEAPVGEVFQAGRVGSGRLVEEVG